VKNITFPASLFQLRSNFASVPISNRPGDSKPAMSSFHKKYGYGLRSLVEAQISRIKRCIGETLLTHKIESQKCEGIIIANLINLWNSFGRCVCVKAV